MKPGRVVIVKAETKLKRIMAMPDSVSKRANLFNFACHVLPQCQLWIIATNEWKRLNAINLSGPKNPLDFSKKL